MLPGGCPNAAPCASLRPRYVTLETGWSAWDIERELRRVVRQGGAETVRFRRTLRGRAFGLRLRARATRVHVSGRITARGEGSTVTLRTCLPPVRVAAAVLPAVGSTGLLALAVTGLGVQWFALVAESAHALGAIPSSSLNPVTLTAVFGLSTMALVWLARTSIAVAWSRWAEPLFEDARRTEAFVLALFPRALPPSAGPFR